MQTGAVKVTRPLVQTAVEVPVVGAMVSLSINVLPLTAPG